jgi:hypothetical protein
MSKLEIVISKPSIKIPALPFVVYNFATKNYCLVYQSHNHNRHTLISSLNLATGKQDVGVYNDLEHYRRDRIESGLEVIVDSSITVDNVV